MTVKIRPYRKGGFEVDIMIRLPNGQPYRERRKSPFTAKAASLRWANERERYLLIHGPTPRGDQTADNQEEEKKPEVPTLAEFAPRYIEGHVIANGLKPSVLRVTRSHLRIHLIPAFGDKRLDQISFEDLQHFKASLAPQTNQSINNILATFNTLIDCAVRFGIFEQAPVKAKHLRVVTKPRDFFDFEEYARLLRGAESKGPIHLAIVLLAGDAGLRAGEIRALHWSSIDWRQNLLTVERSEYKGHITLPKHDKIRTVPMTKRLAAALRDLDRTHPTVFARDNGRPFSSRMIELRLTHAEREAGLREKGPHTLRHSFCSHLAMRGVPVRVIMQLAGHSRLETTQNYMHLSPGAVETAIAALEEPPPRQGISQHPVRGEAGGDMLETVRPPLVGPQ